MEMRRRHTSTSTTSTCTCRNALSRNDFRQIFGKVYPIRQKWRNIGIQLNINPDVLENIDSSNPGDADKSLQQMLRCWLSNDTEASWSSLIDALRHHTVSERRVAEEIRTQNPCTCSAVSSNSGHSTMSSTLFDTCSEPDVSEVNSQCTNVSLNHSLVKKIPRWDESSIRNYRGYKVIIIGDIGCGKTSIMKRFISPASFRLSEIIPTIVPGESEGFRFMKYDDKFVKLTVWDTVGMERVLFSMDDVIFRRVDAAIIVFDVSSRLSFHHAVRDGCDCQQHRNQSQRHRSWIKQVMYRSSDNYHKDPIMILVGNKIDIREDSNDDHVGQEEAHREAQRHGISCYHETSCCDTDPLNIDLVFSEITMHLMASGRVPRNRNGISLPAQSQGDNNGPRTKHCGCC